MDSRKSLNIIFIKIRAVGAELFHVDRQTVRQTDRRMEKQKCLQGLTDPPATYRERKFVRPPCRCGRNITYIQDLDWLILFQTCTFRCDSLSNLCTAGLEVKEE